MRAPALALVVAFMAVGVTAAQTTQSPPAQAPPAAAPSPPARPAPDNYSYEPAGRRDPFLNLIGTGTEPRLASRRVEGPAGMSVGEISVRGIMQSRGAL